MDDGRTEPMNARQLNGRQLNARQATDWLEAVGVGRRQARRVLAAGLAGPPVVTRGAMLFDESAVAALAARPRLDDDVVDAACPWGLFIARREVDLTVPADQQFEALRARWGFSPWTSVWLRHCIDRHGQVPLVATVGGFVVAGAEIVGTAVDREGCYDLTLRGPGAWFASLRRGRLSTGPGRPWVVRRPMGE